MSTYASWHGEVTVHNNQQTREILARLRDKLPGGRENMTVTKHAAKKTFTLQLIGGDECSFSRPARVDEILLEFAPHIADEVGSFECTIDDESPTELWIGPPELIRRAMRNSLVCDAREALDDITVEEAALLLRDMHPVGALRLPRPPVERRAWPAPGEPLSIRPRFLEVLLWLGITRVPRDKVTEIEPFFILSNERMTTATTAIAALRRLTGW